MNILDLKTSYSKNGDVILTVILPQTSAEPLESLLETIGDKYDKYELSIKSKIRSLDANAYLWVLCQKIAEKIGSTKEDVYRHHIRDIGQWQIVPISEEAVEFWINAWCKRGYGWFAERMDGSKLKGYTRVINYFGSSIYTREEMSALLDSIIEEAESLKIDTRTPNEIARMKALWGGKE